MTSPHQPVDPRASFPEMEQRVLARWREHEVFKVSLERRADAPRWGFFEGPPTANGAPGAHHVLARVFKDIFPRYRTMRGYRVDRRGGWDCHGLPVELAVERELGMTEKADIERYGIAKFNARCREVVLSHIDDWTALTERIGFWVDTEHAYRTLDTSYVESVWWALKTIHTRGLLFERLKVVPYCPRCGTALSSHELGQPGVYQDVVDPSAYVILPSERGKLVVWTTTPWTLVSNAAVAVDPQLTYVLTGDGYIVAEALAKRLFGEQVTISERFPGAALVGLRYQPPFDFIPGAEYGERAHTVLAADFVTAQDGTGLVHTAIAFGEDDFRLGQENGLEPINPVLPDGTYGPRIKPWAGIGVKAADPLILEDLERRGLLLRSEPYEHSYPHCWRCNTALLYYAKPSWYIATSQVKDQLLAANETIGWQPPHVKHGRFGNWLEGNVDWALSRERYWGTPLPVWRCPAGHLHVVGSLTELEELSGTLLKDPHRPFVDDVSFACQAQDCGETMRRVPDVIDVWFDSGSMPFASYGAMPSRAGAAPARADEEFEAHFPADYICEALDQTRGWFYSMLAVSTLLFGESSYRNVLCLGLILDEQGQKMSKSKGNIVEPWEVLDTHGADAFRWYFFTSKYPWDGYRFSMEAIGEAVRQFLLTVWNTYGFYVLYANANGVSRESLSLPEPSELGELDRWALSRLQLTTAVVQSGLDSFDATGSGRAIAAFVDELSNWYVRRSRRRFWDGEPAAMATLHHILVTLSELLAPFTPFIADEIYWNLCGEEPSVHLCDFPAVDAGARDGALEDAMDVARETVRLGLAARAQAKVKLRQPLRAAVVVAAGAEREAIVRLSEIVRDELNVRELRFVSEADELGEVEVKPNYRTLGPRFGSQMPMVAAAVAGLNAEATARALRAVESVHIDVGGSEHALGAEDLLVSMRPLAGYQVEREGSHAVALELEIDDSLRAEGWAREIVHAVQAARRTAGLEVSDRIELTLDGAQELLAAAREHERYLAGEVLAVSLTYGSVGEDEATGGPVTIDGLTLRLALARA
ncbi:isoleucine--tRNA ligase [Conexibacter sp. S30A1]|uniref:isoleucine--tRNA ligase n=1 Tax=Conexibacter sp. S30A1 TaxID=2937800 RepID=UPI00200CB86D|nr:isoleucine--tRNA ligase [Conexibacter sp. S30A1]